MGTMSATILGTLSVLLTALLVSPPSYGASLRASCHLEDEDNGKMEGVNVDDRYPIASVSKIMTAYWAVAKMGIQGRFQTLISLRKVSNDTYDIHLRGSRDPYLGKWAFQYITSELNKLGVQKVRQLTFDENFKFLVDTTGDIATARLTTSEPSPERVMRELRAAVSKISTGLDGLRAKASKMRSMSIPSSVKLTVEDIQFQSMDDFHESSYDQTLRYRSTDVIEILKEMNRNSNNYAANNIFESLGGADRFHSFIKERLNLGTDSIRFVNGSGDAKVTGNDKVYNEATCRAVIRVIQALRAELKKNGLGLHHVLAVAGRSANGERSTVDMYKNDDTNGAIIAKTGTVNPAITLAGMLTTEEGNVYFGHIYKTNGTGGDWRSARQKIKVAVTKLINQYGGGDGMSDRSESFLAFDESSKLSVVERMR